MAKHWDLFVSQVKCLMPLDNGVTLINNRIAD